MKDFVFTDKNGKKVTINKGFRFSATDRNGTTYEYEFTGEMYYYELVLTNLTDGTETRVVSNWFSERVINF